MSIKISDKRTEKVQLSELTVGETFIFTNNLQLIIGEDERLHDFYEVFDLERQEKWSANKYNNHVVKVDVEINIIK